MISIPFIVQIPTGVPIEGALGHDIFQMIIHAGPMVKFVLWILLLFSIISWAIIFVKFRLLQKAKRETESFLDLFWENSELKKIYQACEDLTFSPVARLFSGGYSEFHRIRKIQTSSGDRGQEVADGKKPFLAQQAIMDNRRGR